MYKYTQIHIILYKTQLLKLPSKHILFN